MEIFLGQEIVASPERDFAGAREAYQKFVTLSSDGKEIEAVKKRIAGLPKSRAHGK